MTVYVLTRTIVKKSYVSFNANDPIKTHLLKKLYLNHMQFNIFKFLFWITFHLPIFNAILLEVFISGRIRVNSSKENQGFKTSRQYLDTSEQF